MKKTIITTIAFMFSLNVFASSGNFSALSGHRILFGSGLPTWECRHIVYHANGSQTLISYGFATADYGYCPGYETTEYSSAYSSLFNVSAPDHDPNAPQCKDDPENLRHGF